MMTFKTCIYLAIIAALAVLSGASARANPIATYGGHDYFLTSVAESWSAAEAEAIADGGHLASIHSTADNQFIVDTFLSGANTTAILWLGLYDPQQNDGDGAQHASDFVWSDGTAEDYTNWNADTGEPNNYGDQEYWTAANWHYAATGSGTIGSWNDMPELGSDSYSVVANGPYYGLIEVPVSEPGTVLLVGLAAISVTLIRVKPRHVARS